MYAAELPAEAAETTAGEFWECCTRFAFINEGQNQGGGAGGNGGTPVTTNPAEKLEANRSN